MRDLTTRIIAKIDDVRYQSFLTSQLNVININDFDINTTPTSCIVKDEVLVDLNNYIIELIESKNSSSALLPSKADIKDGLLKMILYTNLKNLQIQYLGEDINNLQPQPILRLTSASIKSEIESSQSELLDNWFLEHAVKSKSTKLFIQELFQEARYNNFVVQLKSSK